MQRLSSTRLRFHQVDTAPQGSGIYAWYCRYELTERDIESLLARLGSEQECRRREVVKAFLRRHIFDVFEETPYKVLLHGALKPHYQGEVGHVFELSNDFIDRLVTEPARLRVLAYALRTSVPEFSSPLYIGAAGNLRRRLRSHVALMRRLREGSHLHMPDEITAELSADHSFAHDAIIARGLDPNDLWVCVLAIPMPKAYTFDIEHILNRINYPLCGRN